MERELNPSNFYYKKYRNGICDRCCDVDDLEEINDEYLCFKCRNKENMTEEIEAIIENEEPKELRRSFGGKLDGFISSLEEAHEKRHLKAYLKGDKYFRHGFHENKEPRMYDVIENWNEVVSKTEI